MKPFYISGMLRSLVFALVGIFTPIYVYKLGLNVFADMRYGIILVACYFILTRITTLLLAIPISWIIERIGFRRSIAVSLFLLILNLSSLLLADTYIWLIVLSAITGGLNIPFYWIARGSAISQDSDKKHVGTQMGTMTTVEQVATLLGPLCAGLIIEKWGFHYLYAIALVILLTSIVPLVGMPHHTHKNGAAFSGFWYFIHDRRYFHIAAGVGARAIDDYAISVLWPLAIFVIGIKTGTLGGIFTVVSISVLLVRIMIGRVFDKLHSRRDWSDEILFSLSALVNSIIWIIRLFVSTLGSILFFDISGSIFGTIYSSFYIDYEQLGGKRMGSIAYWVYGEMMYSIMTIGLFVAVGIGAWYGVWKEVFIILASFWMLISIVMARESNMK